MLFYIINTQINWQIYNIQSFLYGKLKNIWILLIFGEDYLEIKHLKKSILQINLFIKRYSFILFLFKASTHINVSMIITKNSGSIII